MFLGSPSIDWTIFCTKKDDVCEKVNLISFHTQKKSSFIARKRVLGSTIVHSIVIRNNEKDPSSPGFVMPCECLKKIFSRRTFLNKERSY